MSSFLSFDWNKKCLDQIRSVEARASKHLQYTLLACICKRRVFTNITYLDRILKVAFAHEISEMDKKMGTVFELNQLLL